MSLRREVPLVAPDGQRGYQLMRIPTEATISQCEVALRSLSSAGRIDALTLPTHYKHASVGGECSWAQFLITWANRSPSGVVETYVKSADDDQIEQLPRRLLGFLLSLTDVSIHSMGKRELLTTQLGQRASERLALLQSTDPFSATRGPAIEVVAADHIGKSCPAFLYRRNRDGLHELRPRDQFVRLARYLIEKTEPTETRNRDYSDVSVAIGNLLFETYKNTEDHALTTLNGDQLPISFRLFQAASLGQSVEALLKSSEDYLPLTKYFSRFHPKHSGGWVKFFTLSVLDSGPGFAATWTRREIRSLSDSEEYQATLDCFSSGTSKGHSRFGQGLPLLKKILKQRRGFLRLRTGRQSLYYDAAGDEESGSDRIPLFRSPDPDGRGFAEVLGTLITVVIPLADER